MIECDVGTHRMPDQDDSRASQVRAEGFEILIERADFQRRRMIAVAVPAEVESHHVVGAGQRGRQMIPPVCVGASPMKQNQVRCFTATPAKCVQHEFRRHAG